MKKFKVFFIMALLAMALGLGACGRADADAPNNEPPPYEAEDVPENEQPDYQPDGTGGIDWSLYPIIIDGERGVAANWHTASGEDFPTHIPFIPVAEALGAVFSIEYSDPQVVTVEGLNGTIVFTVGSYDFDVEGNAIELWQPSLLVDGNIYVPIAFFRNIYGMGNAAWMGGHVHLDTHGADDMH
ncbi:MAG: copper amine oxidase N-terminal domain-containing protein [Defluviitaleaceae bacterium]|nr:copper amine oxidase N-terminal domain-containing protein [Defluviitaleaceae bacterium]